jgi:hypothetical protein
VVPKIIYRKEDLHLLRNRSTPLGIETPNRRQVVKSQVFQILVDVPSLWGVVDLGTEHSERFYRTEYTDLIQQTMNYL